MILTKRDIELFNKLATHGMLSTKQTALHVFSSIATTTVLRRLRLLEANYYLKRITGLETQEVLWILTEKGAEVAGVLLPKRHWNKNILAHDFKLLGLRLSLEKSGIAKSWIPEHEIRSLIFKKYGPAGNQKLIPDGLMDVEVIGKKTTVAVELELTLKNQTRIKEIVGRYRDKKDISAVWYVATSKSILKSVFREWRAQECLNQSLKFYGSLYEDVMENQSDATLYGERSTHKINDIWKINPAHSSAQRVSSTHQLAKEQDFELTEENQRIKNREFEKENAVLVPDLPLPTLFRV